jgi:hypothetical protein
MFFIPKKRKRKKLKKFIDRFNGPVFDTPAGYRELKTEHIEVLKWLLASYEMRSAVSPKEMLEHVLGNYYWDAQKKIIWAEILYHWIYNNKIAGF